MGVYTSFIDGYAQETTYADGTTIDDQTDTAYLWGAISQKSIHNIEAAVHYRAPGYNAKETPASNTYKGNIDVNGFYGLRMQNGIILWAGLGLSSTAGAGPYTHTITPTSDGTLLPSFVFHHERSGTATTKAYQILGAKFRRLSLQYELNPQSNFLFCGADWIAKSAQKAAFTLDTAPALPATATSTPYDNFVTRTFNSVDIDGLVTFELVIDNGLSGYRGNWGTNWIRGILEAPLKKYQINLTYHPSTIEDDIFDEAVSTGNAYDAVFKFQKAADTNDYIQITATGSDVVKAPYNTPVVSETLIEEVTLEPRALSIEVKDAIAGGAYGE